MGPALATSQRLGGSIGVVHHSVAQAVGPVDHFLAIREPRPTNVKDAQLTGYVLKRLHGLR
jgi:hypothetical protein